LATEAQSAQRNALAEMYGSALLGLIASVFLFFLCVSVPLWL